MFSRGDWIESTEVSQSCDERSTMTRRRNQRAKHAARAEMFQALVGEAAALGNQANHNQLRPQNGLHPRTIAPAPRRETP